MPSRRMIHPGFWQSYTMAELTFRQRLLFIGLFSNADDQGRLKGRTSTVRSMVFPNEDISLSEVEADLEAIEDTGSILIYTAGSYCYIQIINWWRYQSPQWAYPSDIPPPDNWTDRLRYRRGGNVITENWQDTGGFDDGFLPDCPEGDLPGESDAPLPKPLRKEPGDKPIKRQINSSLGVDLESSANADADARDPPLPESDEKPQKQLTGRSRIRSDLADWFKDTFSIPQPTGRGKYKELNKLWWTPLLRLYDLCDKDFEATKELVVHTVKVMDSEKLTISSPLSTINTAVSEHAKVLRGASRGDGRSGKPTNLERSLSEAMELLEEEGEWQP